MRRRIMGKTDISKNLINNSKALYESGSINGIFGNNGEIRYDRIRSIVYFDIKPSTVYELKNNNPEYVIALRFYKNEGEFDTHSQNNTNFQGFVSDCVFRTNKDVNKFRIVFARKNMNEKILPEESENANFILTEKGEVKDV